MKCAHHKTKAVGGWGSKLNIERVSTKLRRGFTLAEVLITLGVIGVVAAVALPVLITNITERVQKEKVRSAKYKFTLATDKMKSLGLLSQQYATTKDFVNELRKHLKIAKVCENNDLRSCWPTDEINLPDGTTKSVSSLTTGGSISALGIGTGSTQTMGIITADGTPMILTYSPTCTPLDQAKTYTWSTVDNKPETNATTNCVSAIMDINGQAKPNRIGKDIRTWNSIFGYINVSASTSGTLSYLDCQKYKNKLGINECFRNNTDDQPSDNDYFGGAVKYCYDKGLHLPSMQTLAVIQGARYGRTDMTPYTLFGSNTWAKSRRSTYKTCMDYFIHNNSGAYDRYNLSDYKVCSEDDLPVDQSSSVTDIDDGYYYSDQEISAYYAYARDIGGNFSLWYWSKRGVSASTVHALCVGD